MLNKFAKVDASVLRKGTNPNLGAPRYGLRRTAGPTCRMSVVLNTVDQVLGAAKSAGPQLSFPRDRISAREIVRSRVLMEIDHYNRSASADHALTLLFPAKEEHALNGPRRLQPRPLNAERQIEVALEAVRKGRIVIMFNGVQVSDIDAPLLVTPVSEARFLQLVPLVGG
jgi:hypothetical protein